ncbi:MAG: ABC transporter permease [Rhizobiales bacterium]|jgi:peptide/nickel transport system permease protein|nr:ABC transporter permease [Hyphomicrobiales bacterium]
MIDFSRRLIRSPQGAAGTVIVLLAILIAAVGPDIAPYDPSAMSPLLRYQGPSLAHLLGTDEYGRDILSRLLFGARSTVTMAVLATFLGTLVGSVIGTISAFLGGRADEVIMRTMDAVMSIPSLLFALLIVNLLGSNSVNALLAVAITFIPAMARVTRSVALAVRKQDYINAAVARGETGLYVVTREMLPNVIAPVIVETTIRVSFAIMLFATLSFLGLGAQPPAQEWGLMVAQARQYMHLSAWMLIWPSTAIAIVAIGFNLLGDGLRDVLNPRL